MCVLTKTDQLNWVADQPDHLETGGLFYIKALRTVFVAVYLEGIVSDIRRYYSIVRLTWTVPCGSVFPFYRCFWWSGS